MNHDLFESAQFLLDGAKNDIERFNAAECTFADDPAVGNVVREIDQKTGHKLIKLRITKQPSKELRRLAHHIISDLRHTLDQALFAACQGVLNSTPKSDVYFPFASHPNDLVHKLKRIPQRLHSVIAGQQPYPTGAGYLGGDDVFRLLGELAGKNKHEVALRLGPNLNAVDIRQVEGAGFMIVPPRFDRSKNEVVLIRIERGGYANYKLFVPLYISLNYAKAGDVPISALFSMWSTKVEEILDILRIEAAS